MKYLIQYQAFSLPIALAFLIMATGCEEVQKASVKGIVTIDGKKLDHGTVAFIAGGKSRAGSVSGNIHKDGTYIVQIGKSGEVFVGEYDVEVKSHSPSIPHPQGGPPTPGESIIPEYYGDSETSGLRYNVRSGDNTIDIALVSDQPALEGEEVAAETESVTENSSATKDYEQGTAEKPAETAEEASSEPSDTGDAQPSTEENVAP